MLRSIRWRLVMGTMLLTLLTVSAVGVVALLLMQRYMVEQERAYLSANAEAIAKQAVDFMTPVQFAPPLQQLAHTAAFLSDVNVRIVDDTQMPLADSGAMIPYSATVAMEGSPVYFRVGAPPSADLQWTFSTQAIAVPAMDLEAQAALPVVAPRQLVPAEQMANVIVVQKSPSIWGDRLTFAGETTPISGTLDEANFTNIAYAGATMPNVENMSTIDALPAGAPTTDTALPVAFSVEQKELSFPQAIGLQALDVVTAPIQTNGSIVGWVELGRPANVVTEPLNALRRALGIAAGASALMAIGVGLVMGRSLTAPIQNLAEAAAAMSSGDLTARAPVIGRDELGALARQFNQMADALHQSFAELAAERDTLRRFVADASHELRTPITALRTFNELLQGPAREDKEAQAEFLAESHAQIARLEWITRNLLDLSRWDGGMATLVMREAEVGELVTTAASPFRPLAQERQIDLQVVIPETPLVATIDEQRLGMAVGNLLDNALKFTPSAGRVEVGVSEDEQGMKIWVYDTGMGICAEELPHIFERFYRSPRATQAGSGLGLAIVERIAKAHGAKIDVQSVEGGGSRFTLTMATAILGQAQPQS